MKSTQFIINKENSKVKLKKNATEEVDIEKEWRNDPKYKTELCKNFEAKGVCVYGNKCRFAHGKQELFLKSQNLQNYKLKECISFYQMGYCCYGKRCHFLHSEKNFKEIRRSYYSYSLLCYPITFFNESKSTINLDISPKLTSMIDQNSPITLNTTNTSINMSNISTHSIDSNKSNYPFNMYSNWASKRRLKIFDEINKGRDNVDRNQCEIFIISNFLNNSMYKSKIPMIRSFE
jgi:hypothetical protein